MLKIEGKTFMNIQEAVQWLLDNNALPFQCSANYIGNTEIGLGTIVNPSPAKVRIGSLIFFADSKVSTVIGLTENGFIVSDQYNDLVDDIVYISNVTLNASGHLIVTLSNGNNIDAGLIKQVTNFSINASQHLIVNYNDGTNTDLGAIFSGNITVSGSLTVTGGISGNAITGGSIIENMTGYSGSISAKANLTNTPIYAGAVKNGNKVTFVYFGSLIRTGTIDGFVLLYNFSIPSAIGEKLYTFAISGISSLLDYKQVGLIKKSNGSFLNINAQIYKSSNTQINVMVVNNVLNALDLNEEYLMRYEVTFLLSDSLI